MALLNDHATTLAPAIHKPKPNHKLVTYSRKRKAGILRDTVGSYNRMKRAKSGDGEENSDNDDNNGGLATTAVDGGKGGSSNRDTEESDVEQSSRKHAGSKEGNIRNEGVARAKGGGVEGGKEDEEGEKEGEDEEAENEGQEGEDRGEDEGEDKDQETPIKYIVAVEMRKASESTAPVLHALVQWLGYKDADSMTWEVLDSPVADWKPYYKTAWKREEFFMTRIWASRKIKGTQQYLVEWAGHPLVNDLTWESAEAVLDVFPDGIKTYVKERDGVVDREVGLETQTQPQGPPKIDNP